MTTPHHQPLPPHTLKTLTRTLQITLNILPKPIRHPLTLAYLIARATDTIADTNILPPNQRHTTLQTIRRAIQTNQPLPPPNLPKTNHKNQTPQHQLLQKLPQLLQQLNTLTPHNQHHTRQTLQTIITAQQHDTQHFQHATPQNPIPLQTQQQLDQYTHQIAGIVGQYWTHITHHHHQPNQPPTQQQLHQADQYGKALQLTNILRDLPHDLAQGRCYLPNDQLTQHNLTPQTLTQPQNQPKLHQLIQHYKTKTQQQLHTAAQYTQQLPYTWHRTRLATALPLILAHKTLNLLPPQNPQHTPKITRRTLTRTLIQTTLLTPIPPLWNRLLTPTNQPTPH